MYLSALGVIVDENLVGSLVDSLDLVATENNGLDCPVCVLDVVDLRCNGCDDTKVVAGSLHSPPQI